MSKPRPTRNLEGIWEPDLPFILSLVTYDIQAEPWGFGQFSDSYSCELDCDYTSLRLVDYSWSLTLQILCVRYIPFLLWIPEYLLEITYQYPCRASAGRQRFRMTIGYRITLLIVFLVNWCLSARCSGSENYSLSAAAQSQIYRKLRRSLSRFLAPHKKEQH